MNRRQFAGAGLALPLFFWAGRSGAAARVNEDVSDVDLAALDELLDLNLPDLADKTDTVRSRLSAEVNIINFWASWCAPCVREMPALDGLHKSETNAGVVGISLDTAANIEAFSRKTPVSYPLLTAGAGKISLMRKLGNAKGGLPYSLVLNSDLKPVATILGEIEMDSLKSFIADRS